MRKVQRSDTTFEFLFQPGCRLQGELDLRQNAQKPYQPYAVAAVDLPDGLRVMGRVVTDDPENVPVGAEVELVVEAFGSDDDGNEIVSWMFKPL